MRGAKDGSVGGPSKIMLVNGLDVDAQSLQLIDDTWINVLVGEKREFEELHAEAGIDHTISFFIAFAAYASAASRPLSPMWGYR